MCCTPGLPIGCSSCGGVVGPSAVVCNGRRESLSLSKCSLFATRIWWRQLWAIKVASGEISRWPPLVGWAPCCRSERLTGLTSLGASVGHSQGMDFTSHPGCDCSPGTSFPSMLGPIVMTLHVLRVRTTKRGYGSSRIRFIRMVLRTGRSSAP